MYFIVSWGKDKQSSWSGTNWGLYQALSKYCTIKDICVPSNQDSFIRRILRRLFTFFYRDFDYASVLKNRALLKGKFANKSEINIIFQFAEIIEDSINCRTYIYGDVSAVYMSFLYQTDKKTFAYSGFNLLTNKSYLVKRAKLQLDYYKKCTGIFTMGQWLKNDLIERCKIFPDKIHHVGGGINIEVDKIKPSKNKNKILFIGRDFKRKGGYLVYSAFLCLKKKINNLELHIAGPKHNPISNPIDGYHFHGDCSHVQVSDLLNKCDVFCMPSYFEAYGLVFIEALTYGLPCIGRNCYEMPFFIEHGKTGFLLENDDEKILAHYMEVCLTNEDIRTNVLQKREWYIREYSWDTVAKRILRIINH